MVKKKKLSLVHEGSDLALWQANFVKKSIEEICQTEAEIEIIHTKGDKILDVSLTKLKAKVFTKELEDALLNQTIDLAIHSMKDLPTTSPAGLCFGRCFIQERPKRLFVDFSNELGWYKTP